MKKLKKLKKQLAVAKEKIEFLKEENSELQLIIDTLGKKKTGDKFLNLNEAIKYFYPKAEDDNDITYLSASELLEHIKNNPAFPKNLIAGKTPVIIGRILNNNHYERLIVRKDKENTAYKYKIKLKDYAYEDIKSYKLEINKLKEYSDTLKEQIELLKSELAEYKPYEDFIREIKSEKETYIEALKKVHNEALYRPSEDLWAETRESLFYQDNLINMLAKLP